TGDSDKRPRVVNRFYFTVKQIRMDAFLFTESGNALSAFFLFLYQFLPFFSASSHSHAIPPDNFRKYCRLFFIFVDGKI
ncbi:MAG: hypothetical protein JXB17_10780, partial [Bacteroidales bacterium]|nr:hypothetical protein [Bacteroidales bacterium]